MSTAQFFSTSTEGSATVLTFAVDRLDQAISDSLKLDMRDAIVGHNGPVILDLNRVNFVDSSGIGALVSLRKHVRSDRAVQLRNTSDFVTKVLRMTKLDRVFDA